MCGAGEQSWACRCRAIWALGPLLCLLFSLLVWSGVCFWLGKTLILEAVE